MYGKALAIFLEKELIQREHTLYLSAKELEESSCLKEEMNTWENNFSQDGFN